MEKPIGTTKLNVILTLSFFLFTSDGLSRGWQEFSFTWKGQNPLMVA